MVMAGFVAALGLTLLHVFAGRLRFLDSVPRSRVLSAAGGISVAYVFVHLLPELAAAQEEIAASLTGLPARLEDHAYLVALVGLITFYLLDRHAVRSRARQRDRHGTDETEDHVAGVAFASYATYNAIVGYLLTQRSDPVGLLLFASAIGVHLVVVDHGLRDHHGRSYRRWGRWVCGSALLVGWGLGVTTAVPAVVLTAVLAFLAGGVVMNTIKEELPEQRESRLGPFVAGAASYTVLLLLV